MKNGRTPYFKAQAMLEYLLVMVVIVVIVFVSFKPGGGVLEKTHGKTAEYFDTGSTAIMGGYWDDETKTYHKVDPSKIDGDWCAWTTCLNGYKSRECACPRPAFGGKACDAKSPNAKGSGEAVISCSGAGGEPPEECIRYRCHMGHGEESMGVSCKCPDPLDEPCEAGDEAIVCH